MSDLKYSMVPHEWAVCFQEDCPLKENCLRFAVGKLVPKSVMNHNCVLPNARKDDGCRKYVANEQAHIARGMHELFNSVKPWEATEIRQRLFEVFGSRAQYYRYFNGEKDITPELQGKVIATFREFGYDIKPVYDSIERQYHFPA